MDPGHPTAAAGGPAPAGDPTGGWDVHVFLPALQALWTTRELRQLKAEAWRGFAALDDPRASLLDLLEGSRAWRGKGPTLEAWVTRELELWLQAQHPPGPAQGSPGLQQLQARAFRVLTESPLVSWSLWSASSSCGTQARPLLAHIHRLHQEGKFTEAVMLGTELRLQPELDFETDKANLLEHYVAGFPGLQRRLVALMDSWCQPGFDIRVVARRYPQATSWRLEKLSPRVLTRQVLGLLQRYSLDPGLCPNVAARQHLATLQHLCHMRFVERSVSQESWVDCVRGLVGPSEWLQEQLLQLLALHSDPATAARCALDLALPEERLPAAVATELSRLRLRDRTAEVPSEDTKDHYYKLPISREDIHFLASWEGLSRHKEELLQPGQVVGLDLEWRPSFGVGGRPQASLMQVAVEGRVFLLDLPALSQPAEGQAPQAFSRLVSQLLSDPSITKLGYGMAGDLKSLGASCPALAHSQKLLQGDMDLLQAHRQIRVTNMPVPGVDGAGRPRGLSLLVQQVLGKPLDKTQQLSNWDRRPLDEGQLLYAAADAYCLLEVYQALCREPARFHLPQDLARSPRLGHSQRPGAWEPPHPQEASAQPWQVPLSPEVPARAFRVVCDSMLQGLARRLRCLGADVLVLGASGDHRQVAEVARQEGRIILTSGLPYHKLRAQVGAGNCLWVDCSLKARDQAKAVLRHFNVRVTHRDIFSRCQACNCNQYLKVSKDKMQQLMWLSGHQKGPSSTGDEVQIEDTQKPGGRGTAHRGRTVPGSAPGEIPGGCAYDPPCRCLEEADLHARVPATLGNGTQLQLAGVPEGLLQRPGPQHFYCCTGCGKVFWEGSHLGRITSQFREILDSAGHSDMPSAVPSPPSGPS
ncbi:exonuclease mut-7 homolog isoform X2 [Desmodus rotundus]|uniref:exonuclease mut-7 homolog isoform X2 n=1 Tax=Desmodus rotundus TaxID=9430 RepID=UPI00238166DB|nr:exonuclease mut-7 homolog isoform X2 [Desmodus rotundus]